ncbi:MAG: cyclase family protein [Synergistota bacterium]|nr:cyclase family protein [Synergistota bacterium]
MDLMELYRELKGRTFVDLTHSFCPGIPHYPALHDMERRDLYTVENDGFWVEKMTLVGQWGTHVDSPRHFVLGGRTVDLIDVKEMFLPLVVLDLSRDVSENPDRCLSREDITAWEDSYGKVPEGCFFALRTDWSKRWPDCDAMDNKDEKGIAHYPGYSLDSLRFLYEERGVTASGHETADTDCGVDSSNGNMVCEHYVLVQDRYQIELMANLDKVPPKGALIVAAFPKLQDGSGFPARCFAILP